MPEVIYSGNCLLTMGVFDVCHRGHQHLLSRAKEIADENNLDLVIMTFSPHPTRLLFGEEKCTKLLYPVERRIELLQEFEPAKVIVENFTWELANKSPDEFISYLKQILPNLKFISIGFNFACAKNATGDVSWLKENLPKRGIGFRAVRGLKYMGDVVSSTRIRNAIKEGYVQAFYDLTTRYYDVSGKVEQGNQLGRTIGIPTLNLPYDNECTPKFGVYVSQTTNLETGEIFPSVSNLGIKPSIAEKAKKPSLETHVLIPTNLGYGSDIKVELLEFIRPEKKFDSLEKLCNAMQIDKDKAIDYWAYRNETNIQ